MIKNYCSQAAMKKLAFFVAQKFRQLLSGWNFSEMPDTVNRHDKDENSLVALIVEITRLMTEEKIFKSPNVDLKNLSERLNTPSYLVTKAINEGLGLNFHELINRYRVEEVKSLLISHDHKRFTLMSVAFNAGFSSKTTFNTVFKKMTGLTPSSYRNQYCVKY